MDRIVGADHPARTGGRNVVVGVVTCNNVAECFRVVNGHLQFAIGEHDGALTANQNRQQSGWMVCLGATSCILTGEFKGIRGVNDFNDEASRMSLG